VRWRFLLRHFAEVPKRRLVTVSFIGFTAILVLPWRLGEIVRPYMIRTPANAPLRPGEKPITMAAAMSTVVAERIADGFFLGTLILSLALYFVPINTPLATRIEGIPLLTVAAARRAGYVIAAFFATGVTTLAVFYFARAWAHRTTLAVFGVVSVKLGEKLAGLCEKFADGLHVFGRGRDAAGFLWETTLYWLINAGGMWLLAWGCGIVHADGSAPTLGEAFGLMGMLGCAILIPGPPGLIGVFQAGVMAGMTMYYPAKIVNGPGSAFVFLLYATQVATTLVLGVAALWAEGRSGVQALEEAEGLVGVAADAE
jgi:hypothetical protein